MSDNDNDNENRLIAEAKSQLQNPLVSVRLEAALTLAKHGDMSGRDVLLDGFQDNQEGARGLAGYYAGRIGALWAIQPLAAMLANDPHSNNRNVAIYALQDIGRAEVIPHLIKALGDEDAERREDARTALFRLLGDQVLPVLANPDDLINDVTGEVERDAEEVQRVSHWWQSVAGKFQPGTAYRYGFPESPGILIAQMKAQKALPVDELLTRLEDWTGENFGSEPIAEVITRWESWWRENADKYEPGRKYFHGRRVD